MNALEMLQQAIIEVQRCVVEGRSPKEESGDIFVGKISFPSGSSGDSGDIRVLTMAVGSLLLAFASSMGECQDDIPYSPLRPIQKDGKIKWCCNHATQHCGT